MKLWIRSQNREQLSKPNKLYVKILNEERYEILSGEGFYVLGTYKTKERALEVLDEIQKLLMPKMIYHTNNVEFIPDYQTTTGGKLVSKNDDSKMEYMNMPIVYSMPKE